jgi:hypothetical protein
MLDIMQVPKMQVATRGFTFRMECLTRLKTLKCVGSFSKSDKEITMFYEQTGSHYFYALVIILCRGQGHPTISKIAVQNYGPDTVPLSEMVAPSRRRRAPKPY